MSKGKHGADRPEKRPGARPVGYDEAPATQEDDGGESILEGHSREDRDQDWDALEEPPQGN